MALALLMHMTNVSVTDLVIKVGNKGTKEDQDVYNGYKKLDLMFCMLLQAFSCNQGYLIICIALMLPILPEAACLGALCGYHAYFAL